MKMLIHKDPQIFLNVAILQIIFPMFKKHHEEIDQQARIVHDSFMEKFGKLIYGNGKMKKW